MTAAPTSPYTITIHERDDPGHKIIALLGDGLPTPAGGGGGYEVTTAPKRKALTVWRGTGQGNSSLLSMSVPIIVGGHGNPVAPSVRGPVNTLINMWRPGPTIAPPVLKIRCLGDVVPYQNVPWVLDDFQWGAAVADQQGRKTMQALTLVLMEFVDDERLKLARLQTHKGSRRKHRTYTVKQGDTLTSIAKHFKIKGGWRALGQAQNPNITDPRKIHPGQKLLIPTEVGVWGTSSAIS